MSRSSLLKQSRKMLSPEQKLFEITGMILQEWTGGAIAFLEEEKIEQRMLRLAEKIGWRQVMKKAKKVIEWQAGHNCRRIARTIGKGDPAFAPYLVHLLADEQIDEGVRWELAVALRELGNKKITLMLANILPNERLSRVVRVAIIDTIGALRYLPAASRLIEISQDKRTSQWMQERIAQVLRNWQDGGLIPSA